MDWVMDSKTGDINTDPRWAETEESEYVHVPVVAGSLVPISQGLKYDEGKPRLDLIPPELLFAVAVILGFGVTKYAERNWEKGMSWGRVFGALMRHMWKWWRGDKCDEETGKSHLHHAACCIAFLIAYEERGIGEDDRPKI